MDWEVPGLQGFWERAGPWIMVHGPRADKNLQKNGFCEQDLAQSVVLSPKCTQTELGCKMIPKNSSSSHWDGKFCPLVLIPCSVPGQGTSLEPNRAPQGDE